MQHSLKDEISAQFGLDKSGKVYITFADPAYVRAEVIIYDRKDSSLHAVLHESAHLIGHVKGDLQKELANRSEVVLTAPHYFSGTLNLRTPLVISN